MVSSGKAIYLTFALQKASLKSYAGLLHIYCTSPISMQIMHKGGISMHLVSQLVLNYPDQSVIHGATLAIMTVFTQTSWVLAL